MKKTENNNRAFVKTIPGVRGFVSTTYAVFTEDKCIAVYMTKAEAKNHAAMINAD